MLHGGNCWTLLEQDQEEEGEGGDEEEEERGEEMDGREGEEGGEEQEEAEEEESEGEDKENEARAPTGLPALEDIKPKAKAKGQAKVKGKGKGEGKGKGVVATAEEKNQDNMAAVAQLKKNGKGGRGKCGGKGDARQLAQTAKATGAPPKAIPKLGKKGTGKDSAALVPKSGKKKKGNDDADPDANARTPSKPPNNKRGASSIETPDKDVPPTGQGRRTTGGTKKPKIAKPSEIVSNWDKREQEILEELAKAREQRKEEEEAKAREKNEMAEEKKRQYRENNILAKKFDLLVDEGKIPDHILQMHRAATGPSGKREILKQLFVKEGDCKFWKMDLSKPMFQESSTRSMESHDTHKHMARSRMIWEATLPGGPRILILTHCKVCSYMRLGGFVILVLLILMMVCSYASKICVSVGLGIFVLMILMIVPSYAS